MAEADGWQEVSIRAAAGIPSANKIRPNYLAVRLKSRKFKNVMVYSSDDIKKCVFKKIQAHWPMAAHGRVVVDEAANSNNDFQSRLHKQNKW